MYEVNSKARKHEKKNKCNKRMLQTKHAATKNKLLQTQKENYANGKKKKSNKLAPQNGSPPDH